MLSEDIYGHSHIIIDPNLDASNDMQQIITIFLTVQKGIDESVILHFARSLLRHTLLRICKLYPPDPETKKYLSYT